MEEVLLKRKIVRWIFLTALVVPLALMTEYLTYDECWSLLHFSPLGVFQIMTDLALPNNHPLNTLLLKILSCVCDIPLWLRLPSLLCGAMIPVLCGELAFCWSRRNRIFALISAGSLAAISVPIAVYSALARGYALQLFFLLLCIRAMTLPEKHSRRAAVLLTAGAIGAILSVPSGALFLLPAAIGYLIYTPAARRFNRDMWIGAGVIVIFAGIFYGMNFSVLRQGQNWGMKIGSLADFGKFIRPVMFDLLLVPSLAAAIPVWKKFDRRWWALLLLALPLLLAVFSNGGPQRCYLYLAAALAVAGGIGLAEIFPEKWGKYSILAALLLGGGNIICQVKNWQMTDYPAVFQKHQRELPPETLAVYRASAGFPVVCNLSAAEVSKFNLSLGQNNWQQAALFEVPAAKINGLDENGSETLADLPGGGKEYRDFILPCRIYTLQPVNKLEAGKCYLAAIPCVGNLPENAKKYGTCLQLNPWLYFGQKLLFINCRLAADELPPSWKVWKIGE